MLPVDADFNAATRTIMVKVDVYLNGISAAPVSITRDNYLIDLSLLEEATAGDTPFANVSANEAIINVYSPQGIFNPANPDSPYYGKMQRNVTVKIYVRTSVGQDWYQMGKFFVTDWSANLSSDMATITADDCLYDVYGRDGVDLPVQRNIAVSTFLTNFFTHFNITPVIPPTLTDMLEIAYINQDNKEFLTTLVEAYVLSCNVSHSGDVTIRRLASPQSVRATLTDADQILTLNAKLSINSDYDTAFLTYYTPSESSERVLLDIANVDIAPGSSVLNYMLSTRPLLRLKHVALLSEVGLCTCTAAQCTSKAIQLTVSNPATDAVNTRIVINGTSVDAISHDLGEQGQNTLKMDNIYIQTPEHAQRQLQFMQGFVSSNIPVITAQIRGNPLLEIGDKIELSSARDNVVFTGILMRQQYTYNGGLSSEITLLNSALVEEVAS